MWTQLRSASTPLIRIPFIYLVSTHVNRCFIPRPWLKTFSLTVSIESWQFLMHMTSALRNENVIYEFLLVAVEILISLFGVKSCTTKSKLAFGTRPAFVSTHLYLMGCMLSTVLFLVNAKKVFRDFRTHFTSFIPLYLELEIFVIFRNISPTQMFSWNGFFSKIPQSVFPMFLRFVLCSTFLLSMTPELSAIVCQVILISTI